MVVRAPTFEGGDRDRNNPTTAEFAKKEPHLLSFALLAAPSKFGGLKVRTPLWKDAEGLEKATSRKVRAVGTPYSTSLGIGTVKPFSQFNDRVSSRLFQIASQ